MNALVASVIRTYTPIIVGQLAAWFILIHVNLDPATVIALTAVVGGVLSAVYYTLVRVLEQQWPGIGVLLGLTSSPDTYSKGDPATAGGLIPAPVGGVELKLSPGEFVAPAVSFAPTQAKIDALPEVTPVYTPAD